MLLTGFWCLLTAFNMLQSVVGMVLDRLQHALKRAVVGPVPASACFEVVFGARVPPFACFEACCGWTGTGFCMLWRGFCGCGATKLSWCWPAGDSGVGQKRRPTPWFWLLDDVRGFHERATAHDGQLHHLAVLLRHFRCQCSQCRDGHRLAVVRQQQVPFDKTQA